MSSISLEVLKEHVEKYIIDTVSVAQLNGSLHQAIKNFIAYVEQKLEESAIEKVLEEKATELLVAHGYKVETPAEVAAETQPVVPAAPVVAPVAPETPTVAPVEAPVTAPVAETAPVVTPETPETAPTAPVAETAPVDNTAAPAPVEVSTGAGAAAPSQPVGTSDQVAGATVVTPETDSVASETKAAQA